MKIAIKRIIISVCAAAVIAFSLFFLLRTPVLSCGFYRVPERTSTAIMQYVQESGSVHKWRFIQFDDTQCLSEQKKMLRRVDVLFTPDGCEAARMPVFTEETRAVLKDAERSMTSSIRSAGTVKTDYGVDRYGIPVLLNHFGVFYSKRLFTSNAVAYPPSFDAITAAAMQMRDTVPAPIAVAGGNDSEFLAFIGALTEAYFGADVWGAVCKRLALYTAMENHDADSFSIVCSSPLDGVVPAVSINDILSIAARWEADGLLHSRWASLTDVDMQAFLESQHAAIVFMLFSKYRAVPLESAQNYVSLFIPGTLKSTMRQLTVPVIVACFPQKKQNKVIVDSVANMLTAQNQYSVSAVSGLAPVHTNAETIDRQSSDVRFWSAVSRSLLPPLGSVSCDGAPQEKIAAQLLRNQIAALKMSFVN